MTAEDNECKQTKIADEIIAHCHIAIEFFIALTVLIGVVTGYYYHSGDSTLMFVPLVIAFITTFIAYMFIDLRSELVANRKSRALYLCDTYFLILVLATIVIGVFTGYFYHAGENETMFIPLFIAFMTILSAYLFVEFKGELVADKAVDKY